MNMPNKINTTEVKNKFTKLKESLKKLLISKFNYFSIFTIIFGAVSVSEDAYAGNINQDDSSTTSYDDANDVIFTNAIAITVLAADDTVDTFTMTDNIIPVWAYSGGNDLKVIGAITNTASENLTVNMSGAGSEITLHELSVEGDANGQLTFSLGEGTIVEVTGIDTHIFDIIGAAASKGTFTITGATTMNGGAVGGANGLATINVAAAATFNKTVKAATVNAVAATTFLEDVTATSIVADATVNAQLTDAGTIAGDFTESATGDITSLIIKNSANTEAASITTFSGSIALDTVTIGTSTIGGAATFTNDVTAAAFNIVGGNHADEDSSVITTGDISSTAIVMASATSNAEASLTASGTAAQTIAGTINGDGTVVASGLEVTFSGAIGGTTQVAEVSIANTKAAIFDSTVDAVSLDVDGTATLKTAGNTIGEFELATTGALIIDKAIVDGDTLWTSATQADNTIALGKIYLPGNLSTGQTLKIADSNFGDDVADDLDLVMQDTALTNYKTDGAKLSEKLEPTEVLELLSEYQERMVAAIFKNQGTVDKFIGDAVMATFGTPVTRGNDAQNAISCAREMQISMREWAKLRTELGKPIIKHRIGIHYGRCVVGNIGSKDRMEFAVIGDTVNVASRICDACKEVDAQILISENVKNQSNEELQTEEISDFKIRGREETMKLHKIVL
jgi:class 3 adenylate cyclase